MITNRFFTENSMTLAMVSALRIEPVGLPGLMTTIAFTVFPLSTDFLYACSNY